MAVYCNTEEARAFVATMHPDGLEVPRNVYFRHVSNHIMSAVIFAAMGEPQQKHNLGQVYSYFNVVAPRLIQKNPDKIFVRQNAYDRFEKYEREARIRVAHCKNPSMLDAICFEAGNQWKMDDEPVRIFAVNSVGETALVANMGGFMKQTDANWKYVKRTIESGIVREFGHPDSECT